ncbi:MAG TPA: hypothetical protein VM386_02760 [Acidimicrobiales bacterium]|nr:hypothetical protein [Acidimicrobiales bacterium]
MASPRQQESETCREDSTTPSTSAEVMTSLTHDDPALVPCWLLETLEEDEPDTTVDPPALATDDEELETLTEDETDPPPDTELETSTFEDELDLADDEAPPAGALASVPPSASARACSA